MKPQEPMRHSVTDSPRATGDRRSMRRELWHVLTLGIFVAPSLAAQGAAAAVHSVPVVDLARYAGRWHEVARLPNRFEKACDRNTTADYELLADGTIRVVNTCTRADGSLIRAEGRARLAEPHGSTSRLKVRFAPAFLSFIPMVWGDYWILELTADYGAVLVGDPGRKYLWILSRTPNLDEATYARLVSTAQTQGFDVQRLLRAR
jgi:apolipoprotein D and lipocalin family protein